MQQFFIIFILAAMVAVVAATLLADVIGRSGFPLPPNDRRLGCVDGLRGYLALSVVIHHSFVWIQSTRLNGYWAPPSVNFFNQLGVGSVALFFMTTGLVFYPRILAPTSWLGTYITRVFRIVPLIVVSVIGITLIIMWRTGATPDGLYPSAAAKWISTWSEPVLLGYPESGRMNAYVLWSVRYEWLFYLFILPACAGAMALTRARKFPTWTMPVTLLGASIGARIAAKLLDWPIGVLSYAPLFATGMLAFEIQSRPRMRAALLTPAMAITAGAALLFGMLVTNTPFSISMPFFGFFFICVSCGNDLGGLLRRRGALVLGECSFGIYLLHGVVLDILFVDARALHERLPVADLPVIVPVAAIAVVLVTPATYLLIERPAMRAGRSLSNLLAGRRIRLYSRELELAP